MSATQTNPLANFEAWRARVIGDSAFRCSPIPFAESQEWRLEQGRLRHRTGGFFSIVGMRTSSRHPRLDGQERAIIYQPEIAINGFLLRRSSEGIQVLCQGRVEPGNIEVMQLAPTIQSTEANIKQLHGGQAPPLVEWFIHPNDAQTITDGLQSEEGSRYYGKYNRNVALLLPDDAEIDTPANFCWLDLAAMRRLVVADNVFNTDARSVLACLDWDLLRPEPFAGHEPGSFGDKLRASYHARDEQQELSDLEALHWLARLRAWSSVRQQIVPLSDLTNWTTGDREIAEVRRDKGFSVRQFDITAVGREVSRWDQPLIDSDGAGVVALFCQERAGVLKFLVKADYEEGYLEGVQLSATISVPPGETNDGSDPVQDGLLARLQTFEGCSLITRCRQSEEGGRFYRDENEYTVLELDPGVELALDDDYRWMTLAQIRRLIAVSGVFGIELRDALSLLLAHC